MVTDEALHERLIGGDLSAFDELYARHERPLFGFILRHLRDRAEAEDVLHEAFLSLLRQQGAGAAAQSFRALLFTVARNLCLNRHRSRRRRAAALSEVAQASRLSPGSEPLADGPDHALAQRELERALDRAVGKLPEGLAELYQLRASGLSYEELSAVLAVPLGTVKSRMHEMVRRLREEIGHDM